MKITQMSEIPKNFEEFVSRDFKNYAAENELELGYLQFNFVAEEDGEIIGILTGRATYDDVNIHDLIVAKNYRRSGVGSKLMRAVEEFFADKKYRYINVTTHEFMAPKFYPKLGYELEFISENKECPKLSKYFFRKKLTSL
jgi:ribosomal protein S18 acetylase RimI-like enzyme